MTPGKRNGCIPPARAHFNDAGQPIRLSALCGHQRAQADRAEPADEHGRVELLVATADELLRSQEPVKMVESLCARVMEHLDCQFFFNFLVDEDKGQLRLKRVEGYRPTMFAA